MNMPIQGTVGDLMSEALVRLWAGRRLEKSHLQFKILMSIHDQILCMCPVEQVVETKDFIMECMTTRCPIPKINLTLQADADVSVRWCEKLTQETAEEYGIPLCVI
jgi:DNA polymerase I-like protein with 3'-5' exonuclease and polymerase domains